MAGSSTDVNSSARDDQALKSIVAALRGLRFGSIEISVHEGRIVQIERREKFRLNLACPAGTSFGSGNAFPTG